MRSAVLPAARAIGALTPAGRALLRMTRTIDHDVRRIQDAVANAGARAPRMLRLGVEATLLTGIGAQLVGAFRREEPDDDVVLSAFSGVELLRELRRSTIDIALTFAGGDDSALQTTPLRAVEMLLVTAPDTETFEERVDVADLHQRRMIVVPKGSTQRDYFDDLLQAKAVTTRVAVQTNHRDAIPVFTAGGLGASILTAESAVLAQRLGCRVRRFVQPMIRPTQLLSRLGELPASVERLLQVASKLRAARSGMVAA